MKKNLKETALTKNKWTVESLDGMQIVFSPRLLELGFITHAFTTRVGGETRAPFDSFNLGGRLGDDDMKQDAQRNRRKLLDALSLSYSNLVVPGQVHSRNVEVIGERHSIPDLNGVDGLVTDKSETPLLLHFADCVPVIIVEKRKRLIGIFHAGWRGTASKIVSHGVERMVRDLGGDPHQMLGVVGPAIGTCCYPTSDEVAQTLGQTVLDPTGLIACKGDQPAPDLKAINALQLLESGVGEVDVTDFCTACNPDMFYSHRQSGGNTGRQGALVSIQA